MPKVNSVRIDTKAAGEWHQTVIDIMVSSSGEFYCNVPEPALTVFQEGRSYDGVKCETRLRGAKRQLFGQSFNQLHRVLTDGLNTAFTPEATEENVIQYNIESHISFWETSGGKIVPNGYFAEQKKGTTDRDGCWCGDEGEGHKRRTIRISLRTKCPDRAGDLARHLASCGRLMRENKILARLRQDEMRDIVRSYFAASLDRYVERLNDTGLSERSLETLRQELDVHEDAIDGFDDLSDLYLDAGTLDNRLGGDHQ